MKKAEIKLHNHTAGWLIQDEHGYHFYYDADYLKMANAQPVSLTLPLDKAEYNSTVLFPFFDGLIPEGWLLNIAIANWKINERDRFGLLLTLCNDCIGCVSIKVIKE